MKPTLAQLQALCPDLNEAWIVQHLDRLDDRYFNSYGHTTIAHHLNLMAHLSSSHPVAIDVQPSVQGGLSVTLFSFDYPAVFSLIAGVLSGMGFEILSGGSHTYKRQPPSMAGGRRFKTYAGKMNLPPWARRKIIDHFTGTLAVEQPLQTWSDRLRQQMEQVIILLESGRDQDRSKAKHLVNEQVANRLRTLQAGGGLHLLPVSIAIDNQAGDFTRLAVTSEDTPVFLYSLSNALSLHELAIEHVAITTNDKRVEDLIDVVDQSGHKIEDDQVLERIKLAVLLTKQFTYFLSQAPDPYAALSRFEYLVEDIIQKHQQGKWVEFMSSPKLMQELAKLLGTSDYLWEDMIRQQYETLLPMLRPHVEGRPIVETTATLPDRLEAALEKAGSYEEQQEVLNDFKDREIFLFDLDHILSPQSDFKKLSEQLTFLAEVILKKTTQMVYLHLAGQYGHPRTVAGLRANYAVLGLGKLGGAALGYASDIEIMMVYSDTGETDGGKIITNAEFFDLLVKETVRFIRAKREGIFNLDLRLRPFGSDGPLASSLALFCDYFGQGGAAHAVEKLALVRMRPVAGDPDLGAQLERLRDEFIYASRDLDLKAVRELRQKQFEEKTRGGGINAKFSPGALVDLEYDVQLLQVIYGRDYPVLRTPRIQLALKGLYEVGVISHEEAEILIGAYGFFRNLINGLRILRGSAQDLFMPAPEALEYSHLARRLGYAVRQGLDPAKQLFVDFETHSAAVRAFVEKHFGRDSLPGQRPGNVADLILSETLTVENRMVILTQAGFTNPQRAEVNLRHLAGAEPLQKEKMAKLAVLAVDMLGQKADPDMALNNWERFVHQLDQPKAHFEAMLAQPMRLKILLDIFSTSQFLAEALIHHPDYLEWATDPQLLRNVKSREDYNGELKNQSQLREAEWLKAIRLFRRREFVRIGIRDICLKASLEDITLELSNLADALVGAALQHSWQALTEANQLPPVPWAAPHQHYCLLAFGKLGGQELNYSSDIDLVALYDDRVVDRLLYTGEAFNEDPFTLVTENSRAALSSYTDEGMVYRVDFRLRPYGIAGALVPSYTSMVEYYRHQAELSELQSLIKIRPVAGNLELGAAFIGEVQGLLTRGFERSQVKSSIEHMRNQALKKLDQAGQHSMDIKSGMGGIRDIEFLIQGLQLIYGHDHPHIFEGHTLKALAKLFKSHLIDGPAYSRLSEDYVYLRRLEHFLQIYEDRQVHTLPATGEALKILARRTLGHEGSVDHFLNDLHHRSQRVRSYYSKLLLEKD